MDKLDRNCKTRWKVNEIVLLKGDVENGYPSQKQQQEKNEHY